MKIFIEAPTKKEIVELQPWNDSENIEKDLHRSTLRIAFKDVVRCKMFVNLLVH